ncbi:MAG: TRAP transporter permease [Synergistaceae bacterium]|nr:TRAP transporter permease [Synergistaceae bacterium]
MSNSETPESKNIFDRFLLKAMAWIAIAMSTFHLVTAGIGSLPTTQQRSVHIGFALVLIFLQAYFKESDSGKLGKVNKLFNIIMAVCSLAISVYAFMYWYDMMMRVAFPSKIDLLMGCVAIGCVIYAAKKKLGYALPIMAILFILYALYGNYLPTLIGHRGYTLKRIVGTLYMDTAGIYGQVAGISATYIFLFVLFGAFLESSGAGRFFIDLSTALFGRTKGGSAKAATVASCLFGMVSGSAPANVMAIGPLTIPMMEKAGYEKRFSGAVISVAGTGGQFMPPIMGAAAFIISETLGVPYLDVALAAFIPGVLYYLAIIFIIDIRSNKINIKPLSEVPDVKVVLKNGFYFAFPVLLLVYFLAIARWSPIKSGFWSIIALIAVSMINKETRMTPKKLMKSFELGAMASLDVAIVCSLAGIIIGMLSLTGLGLKFSNLLLALAGGNMVILMLLTMVSALILGMGMTTTSVYIILSVLVSPALVQMGVKPLAAHLFVFYFGILSAITPPVATASYAAASVAGDDPMRLGWVAWKIGLSGYILPFIFIYSPELLMDGSAVAILGATVSSVIGIYALSVAIEGFYKYPVMLPLRALLLAGALLMIVSGIVTDIAGLAIVLIVLVPQYIKYRKEKSNTIAA